MGFATLMLGLAPSYGFAVAARFLGGLSNGSGVAIKTMLAEAGGAQIQAKGGASRSADMLLVAHGTSNLNHILCCGRHELP